MTKQNVTSENWVLVDVSGVHWPGALPWRGPGARRGYATREDAELRARRIRQHYAARYGQSGPDLRARRAR